jgi:UDP-2-acetamido-2,6-beta-L-arabino-hexul-4-ose reductase
MAADMMRVVVTGAAGLLGWHACARLHARNCAARFASEPPLFDVVALDRAAFGDDDRLRGALEGAGVVMHFAGVNRGSDEEIANGNRWLADRLAQAAAEAKALDCHVLYANSIHARGGTVYGAAKREAAEILRRGFARVSDFELPHIFGERARPRYNNVTATLIDDIVHGRELNVNPEGLVELLHAGEAAECFIDAALAGIGGQRALPGVRLSVPQLAQTLTTLHESYAAGVVPERGDALSRALFNCYRFATYPQSWPRELKLHSDPRGTLFEAVRAEGKGQVFMSSTRPGITRGNHFHLGKVERFQVVSGEAVIRIRRVLSDQIEEFRVSGSRPVFIDMPTLHTHSIENVGETDLITLFWADEFFDPKAPDTYADAVLP